ncbi:MAG TPA: hypothetical protein VG796_26650 [Verrucomicrobiales bacterium]|nr:hypothetical protein [Verrucomicrobiales bacterium]
MDIVDFFRTSSFCRFAFTYGNRTDNQSRLPSVDILVQDALGAIAEFNRSHYSASFIAILAEAFSKNAHQYFDEMRRAIAVPEIQANLSVQSGFVGMGMVPKSFTEGMEIADFLSHTAGSQAKHFNSGKKGLRRDFQGMFPVCDRCHFFHAKDYIG